MNLRDSFNNLIALLLLLIGAALVFVWLASTTVPEPEPPEPGVSSRSLLGTTTAAQTPAEPLSQTTEATRTPAVLLPLFTPTPWSLNPERLTIIPLYPALDEAVMVEVRGVAPADCRPTLVGYETLETGYVPVDLAAPAGAPCTAPPAPWTVSFTVDPLSPGHWILEIYVESQGERVRHTAHTIYVAPPGPTPAVTPTTPGDFPTPTPFTYFTEHLNVSPARPTSADLVLIEVTGLWGDGCVPALADYRWEERYIQIDLDARPDPNVACAAVNTPWSQAVELGPLPTGTYQIVVSMDEGNGYAAYAGDTLLVAP